MVQEYHPPKRLQRSEVSGEPYYEHIHASRDPALAQLKEARDRTARPVSRSTREQRIREVHPAFRDLIGKFRIEETR